jgi:hypothetical protein
MYKKIALLISIITINTYPIIYTLDIFKSKITNQVVYLYFDDHTSATAHDHKIQLETVKEDLCDREKVSCKKLYICIENVSPLYRKIKDPKITTKLQEECEAAHLQYTVIEDIEIRNKSLAAMAFLQPDLNPHDISIYCQDDPVSPLISMATTLTFQDLDNELETLIAQLLTIKNNVPCDIANIIESNITIAQKRYAGFREKLKELTITMDDCILAKAQELFNVEQKSKINDREHLYTMICDIYSPLLETGILCKILNKQPEKVIVIAGGNHIIRVKLHLLKCGYSRLATYGIDDLDTQPLSTDYLKFSNLDYYTPTSYKYYTRWCNLI